MTIAKAVNHAAKMLVLSDMVPVAYSVILLTGEKSYGCQYMQKPCAVGDTTHFDHGGGVKPNRDATVEWVKPYFDYKSERDALMKLDVKDRPKVLQGDYYQYPASGLIVSELYTLKDNGLYVVFPTFIVVQQGTEGDFWHNEHKVGERLDNGFNFDNIYKSFTKLCKFEHTKDFTVK